MLARENQSLEEHLENVAILTQKHLNKTPYYSLGYILGKAHDLGKKLDEWQHYLQNSLNGISQRKIDHSTAGSQFIFNLYKGNVIGKILSHVIASHHSGLLNSTGNVSLNNIDDYANDLAQLSGNVNGSKIIHSTNVFSGASGELLKEKLEAHTGLPVIMDVEQQPFSN